MPRFLAALTVLVLIAAQVHGERYVYRPKYKSIPPKPKVEETIQAKPIVPPPPSARVYSAPRFVAPRPVQPPPPPPAPRPQMPTIVYIQAPAAAPVREVVDNSDELREIAWEIARLRRDQEFRAMWHDDDCRYGRGYYPPVLYGYGGGYRPMYLPVPGYPNGF